MTRLPVVTFALAVLLAAHPAEATSCLDLIVRVTWDESGAPTAQGVVARLELPEGVYLETDTEGSVKARVENLTGAGGGLFDAVPHDVDEDGRPDQVNIGLLGSKIAAGPFVRVSFACQAGTEKPAPSEFGCVSEVSAMHGMVESSCSLVEAPAKSGDA